MRFRLLITCLLAVVAFAATAAAAQACTETWNNTSGGDWDTPTNWTPNGVPGTNDVVCITAPGTYTVTLEASGGDTVQSLTLGGSSGTQTLDIAGQDYEYQGEYFPFTTLGLNDPSTITSNGKLVLDATSGGPSEGAGNPTGGNAVLNSAALTNSGQIVAQSEDPSWGEYFSGSLTEEPSASLDVNSGTFTMPSPNGGGYGASYAYSLTNDGSLAVASNAGFAFTTGFGGGGGVVNNGTVTNNGSITGNDGGGQVTWTQSGGSESGNPVTLQGGAWLIDSAGPGSFLFNYESGALSGKIPAGQTVTVQGEVFNAGGENYNSTSLALNANSSTAPVTNDGTLVLDAPGSGNTSGGNTYLTNGTLDNNGTFVSQVEDSNWSNTLQASLVNGSAGNVDVNSGVLDANGALAVTNNGVVTVAPGAEWLFQEAATLTNGAGGTLVPEIAGTTSYGTFEVTSPCCSGSGAITAGGTLAPKLVGGFTPASGQEFDVFTLDGGKFTGTFASVGSGFGADYAHESASPAFVGVVYGQSAGAAAPSVGKISSSGGKVTVKLSCGAHAGRCTAVRIVGTVKEHLKGRRVTAVSASVHRSKKAAKKPTTKLVTVVSTSSTLAASTAKTVSLKLNATGRRLLARFHKLTIEVSVKIGGKTIASKTVVLRMAKAEKKGK